MTQEIKVICDKCGQLVTENNLRVSVAVSVMTPNGGFGRTVDFHMKCAPAIPSIDYSIQTPTAPEPVTPTEEPTTKGGEAMIDDELPVPEGDEVIDEQEDDKEPDDSPDLSDLQPTEGVPPDEGDDDADLKEDPGGPDDPHIGQEQVD